jgi:hypothetical protein
LYSAVVANLGDRATAWFNLGTGEVGAVGLAGGASVFTAATSAIEPVGDGYRVSLTYTIGSAEVIANRFYAVDGNNALAVTSGATYRIEAPQLEAGSVVTPYQRRVSAFDITEAGQRSVYYLAPDGVDDFMDLVTAFAPAGAYTLAVAQNHGAGMLNPWIGNTAVDNIRFLRGTNNSLALRSDGTGNQTVVSPADVGAAATGRAVLIGRVATSGAAEMYANGAGPLPSTLTGAMIPAATANVLFRGQLTYAVGLFYGGVMIPAAITEPERLALQRYLASLSGVTIA